MNYTTVYHTTTTPEGDLQRNVTKIKQRVNKEYLKPTYLDSFSLVCNTANMNEFKLITLFFNNKSSGSFSSSGGVPPQESVHGHEY